MKKDTILVQCALQNGDTKMTTWLEAKKVKLGTEILISDVMEKDDQPRWWTITGIGSERIAYEKIAGRKASDIWDNPINKMRGNK